MKKRLLPQGLPFLVVPKPDALRIYTDALLVMHCHWLSVSLLKAIIRIELGNFLTTNLLATTIVKAC
jgi:hypothetical protein